MKKKLLYLSSLAVLSVSMVSCIDNDEPAGIKALRQAKADKIYAEIAMDSANARYRNAEAVNKELLNAYQELTNALYAVKVANDKKVDDATTAVELKELETKLVNAQYAYDVAKFHAENLVDSLKAEKSALKYTFAQIIANAEGDYNTYLTTAYDWLCTAESTLYVNQHSLATAEQALLVAYNVAECKDSLEKRNVLADAVATAQDDLDNENKNVELAQATLDDFNALDKTDTEALSKKWNELNDAMKDLDDQINDVTVKEAEATEKLANAQAEYTYYESLLKDSVNDYGRAAGFYSYTIDKAIAKACEDWEIDNGKTGSDRVVYFSVNKTGVLANETAIANKDAEKAFDAALNKIESAISACTSEETKNQYLAEYKAQMESFKKQYTTDKDAFKGASEEYKKAAVKYQYSELDGTSTLYDSVKTVVEAYWKGVKKGDDMKGKGANVAKCLVSFYSTRYTFDGFKVEDDVKVSYTDESSNSQTMQLNDLRPTNITSESKAEKAFEGLIAGLTVEGIIGAADRYTTYENGTYEAYVKAADNLFSFSANAEKVGTSSRLESRFVELTSTELDAIEADDTKKLVDYGSQGKYENALRKVKAIEEELTELNAASFQNLYDAVEKDKNAIVAKINDLDGKLHVSYEQLQKYKDAENAAQLEVDDLGYQKTLLNAEKGNKKTYRDAVKALITLQVEAGTDLTEAEVENYEITIKYFAMGLEQAVGAAQRLVEDKKIALEVAERNLADFDNGEYNVDGNTMNFEGVLKAEQDLAIAQVNYNNAKQEFDLAKAYYADLLASLK